MTICIEKQKEEWNGIETHSLNSTATIKRDDHVIATIVHKIHKNNY